VAQLARGVPHLGAQLVAEIPDLYSPGLTAHMTYYETRAGAKVFAAGAFTFAGPVHGTAQQVLGNLWARLARRG